MPGPRSLITVLIGVLVAAGLALSACGDSDDRVAAEAPPAEGAEGHERAGGERINEQSTDSGMSTAAGGGFMTQATIVGDDLEFDVEELTVPAGEEITITFENKEEQVAHNLRVEAGSEEFKTDIEVGPVTQTLSFTIATPGTYEYVCEVHPQTMKGELVAV